MTSTVDALRKLSARIGKNPLLVQAAGGNTSLKQDGIMWIKASGTWLMDALRKDIFVPLDLTALRHALDESSPDCENCLSFVRKDLNLAGLRPSIETSVHGIMPQSVVIHVHCVNTIALAIQHNAKFLCEQKLQSFKWSFIPYARPGLQLAQAVKDNMAAGTNVMVLQNHGLVVAADTVAEAEVLLHDVVQALESSKQLFPQPDFKALRSASEGSEYLPAVDSPAHIPALHDDALRFGCVHVYYPDHAVFLGATIPRGFDSGAPALAVPGKGILVRKDAKPSVEPMLRCLGEVFIRLPADAKLKALTTYEVDQLLNWDAEKYRQTLKQP